MVLGLNEFRTGRRRGVLEYNNPYPVALAARDVCALLDVRLHRRKQNAFERLRRNIVLLHALLRMPADGHMAEFRDVAVKMGQMASLLFYLLRVCSKTAAMPCTARTCAASSEDSRAAPPLAMPQLLP